MNFQRALRAALLLAGVAAIVLVLAGCAAKTDTSAPDAAGEVAEAVADVATEDDVQVVIEDVVEEVVSPDIVLEYRMFIGPLSYTFTSESTQTMQIKDQSIPVVSAETLSFSVRPNGLDGGVHALSITIDGLSVKASSPQGEMEADTEELVGKGFDMTLTKLGVEGGLPDHDTLMYAMGTEGAKSVIPGFGVIFPDLPDGPIKVGDTWPARLEMTEESSDGSVAITIDAVNTLEGLDTIDGFECARITAVLTGTIIGGGTQQGVPWTMETVTDGTGTWYFAYDEGILVSDWTEGTADGNIVIDGPDGQVTLPVTREFNMVTELLK